MTMTPSQTLAPLPTTARTADVPIEYHGPVDFACYGCGLRSIAAFHNIPVSKGTLDFLGAFRYGYLYLRGRGFAFHDPRWAAHGFKLDILYAARAAGVILEDLNPARRPLTWADLWPSMKQSIARGEPVFLCFLRMDRIWKAAGLFDDERPVSHSVVLVGYDEARGVGVFHDNYWYYENTDGQDVPYVEYPLAACAEQFDPRAAGPYVFATAAPPQIDLATVLQHQSEVLLGTKHLWEFSPPDLADTVVGCGAFLAAADELEAASEQELPARMQGLRPIFDSTHFLGPNGQSARGPWLSGVAAATGDRDVEAAAYHLDASANNVFRAQRSFRAIVAREEIDRAQLEELIALLRAIAASERAAGERLAAAAARVRTGR